MAQLPNLHGPNEEKDTSKECFYSSLHIKRESIPKTVPNFRDRIACYPAHLKGYFLNLYWYERHHYFSKTINAELPNASVSVSNV